MKRSKRGTFIAQEQVSASLITLPKTLRRQREARFQMKNCIRKVFLVALLGVTSINVMAQKRDDDKRPPKPPARVVTQEKKDPPPRNNNRQKPPDNKKKP